MKPDLATIFAGSNDILERGFDAGKLRAELECMMGALVGGKAVVLTFTLPDLTGVMPIGRFLAPRVRAMNDSIREAAASTGAASSTLPNTRSAPTRDSGARTVST